MHVLRSFRICTFTYDVSVGVYNVHIHLYQAYISDAATYPHTKQCFGYVRICVQHVCDAGFESPQLARQKETQSVCGTFHTGLVYMITEFAA